MDRKQIALPEKIASMNKLRHCDIQYCDLQTIAYTHTKSRQCKTMRINAVHVGDSMSDSVSVR